MLNVDGDGFLLNADEWSEDVMYELARNDGLELTEEHVKYVLAARQSYQDNGTVPAIRVFAKQFGMDRKAKPLYDLFTSGVMKRIAKYGGLPKPTGCV